MVLGFPREDCVTHFHFSGHLSFGKRNLSLKFQYNGLRVSEGGFCHSLFTFLGIRVPEGGIGYRNFNIIVLGFPRKDCLTRFSNFWALEFRKE